MTLEHTLEIVKILLQHYGEHPSQNDALIAGALVILEGAPTKQAEHVPKKDKPKAGSPKKTASKLGAPRRGGRPPFDTGKLTALLRAGWDIPKIADEMHVTEATIRKHCREEGLLKDEQQADSV